jgi:hypothetical protein
MALPKVQVQTKRWKSLGGKGDYVLRPFSVKEQKILLVAKESIKHEADPTIAAAILIESLEQVFRNCVLNVEVDDIPSFDFPFILLELRKMSVDNTSSLAYRCTNHKEDGSECGRQFSVKVDLDNLETIGSVKLSRDERLINLTDDIGVCMRYPTFKQFKNIYTEDGDAIKSLRLYIEYAFDKEGGLYPISESTDEELEEFISDLGPSAKHIQEWIESSPMPYYKIDYECKSCGHKKVIELKDMNDFF